MVGMCLATASSRCSRPTTSTRPFDSVSRSINGSTANVRPASAQEARPMRLRSAAPMSGKAMRRLRSTVRCTGVSGPRVPTSQAPNAEATSVGQSLRKPEIRSKAKASSRQVNSRTRAGRLSAMPYPATREPALAQAAEFNSAGFNRHGMWIALDSPSRPALGRGKVLKGQAVGNDIDLHLGRRLRRRRRLLGLTQQQLAASVGVRFQQIQKYECGANRISAARLWRIAAALEVPVGYFYEGLAEAGRREANGEHAEGGEVLARKETLDLVRAYYR